MQRLGQIGEYWLTRNRHGTWQRTWYDAARRQTRHDSLGTRDFDEATVKLAEWVVLHQRLDRAQPAEIPLYVVLERYHEHHGRHTARDGEASALAIAKLKDFFPPATTVAELTLERQRDFENDLRDDDLSDGYIGRIQTVLKAALNRAHEAHELATVPYVRVLQAGKRERILSLNEAAALFNAPLPDHLLVLLVLAFTTLSRPGALLQLQPFQVDLEHRLLALNPAGRKQTKKFRPTVPIVDTLLPWLQARMAQRYFVQWYEGQRKPIGSVKTTWRTLRTAAGLGADVIPYTIRHTMATHMRSQGVQKWEVRGWLGHGSGTTELYAKFAPDYLAAGAAAIDDYMHALQPLVKREIILNVTPIRGRKA